MKFPSRNLEDQLKTIYCLHTGLSLKSAEFLSQRQSWTKLLGTVLQNSYFSVSSRFPLKTVHPSRDFLAVLFPPILYKEIRKKIWIHASNIVCGVRGGVGPVWIGKRPRNAKVSQDFCPWLSEKEVGRKKAILRGFQGCKSVFFGLLMKDRS